MGICGLGVGGRDGAMVKSYAKWRLNVSSATIREGLVCVKNSLESLLPDGTSRWEMQSLYLSLARFFQTHAGHHIFTTILSTTLPPLPPIQSWFHSSPVQEVLLMLMLVPFPNSIRGLWLGTSQTEHREQGAMRQEHGFFMVHYSNSIPVILFHSLGNHGLLPT